MFSWRFMLFPTFKKKNCVIKMFFGGGGGVEKKFVRKTILSHFTFYAYWLNGRFLISNISNVGVVGGGGGVIFLSFMLFPTVGIYIQYI